MKELTFEKYDDFYDFIETAFFANANIELRIVERNGCVIIPKPFDCIDKLQGGLQVAQCLGDCYLVVDGVEVILDFDI